MYILEILIISFLILFMILYRKNDGEKFYKFFSNTIMNTYNKYAPYSYKEVKEKVKQLGGNFTLKQYIIQIIVLGGFFGVVGYLYFYSLIYALIYAGLAIAFIPYLAYLRSYKIYSEYVFEQIQVYTTNVIMEFNTTQSFVKALEGVAESGVLEDPVLSDVKEMIRLSYNNGNIEDPINYMNSKYDYYIVKNMHQLFLQITQEGAKDAGESLENMLQDIDMLVEGVYRDRMDRDGFHKKFITFGFALFALIILIQYLLGRASYMELVQLWYVQIILHGVILINTGFLLSGEKYYNQEVGAE
ncbi:MAG: hypothetical protein RSB41_00415 [Bacilli bacterium]